MQHTTGRRQQRWRATQPRRRTSGGLGKARFSGHLRRNIDFICLDNKTAKHRSGHHGYIGTPWIHLPGPRIYGGNMQDNDSGITRATRSHRMDAARLGGLERTHRREHGQLELEPQADLGGRERGVGRRNVFQHGGRAIGVRASSDVNGTARYGARVASGRRRRQTTHPSTSLGTTTTSSSRTRNKQERIRPRTPTEGGWGRKDMHKSMLGSTRLKHEDVTTTNMPQDLCRYATIYHRDMFSPRRS